MTAKFSAAAIPAPRLKTKFLTSILGSAFLVLAGFGVTASAGNTGVKVEGYFCDAKSDQLAFLNKKAEGENEIMASNAVNKALGRASCMPYIVADAVPTSEQTVMDNGLVYVLRSYKFLPENVERWHGTVMGSLQQAVRNHNI